MSSGENPFVAGKPVMGGLFADREEDIRELAEDILSGQNIVLYSPRRFGKTSLILETLRRLSDKVKYAYVNLYEITGLEELIISIMRQLYGRLDRIMDIVKSIAEGILARIIGSEIRIFGDEREVRDLLTRFLDYLNRTARRKKIVVVLDEFQEITSIDEEVPRVLKSAIEKSKNIVYVFSGSLKSLLSLFSDPSSSLYKVGKIKFLDKPAKSVMVDFIIISSGNLSSTNLINWKHIIIS